MSSSSHQLLSPCKSPSGIAQYRWQSPGSLPVARHVMRSLFRMRPVCQTPPVVAPGALVCQPQPPDVLHERVEYAVDGVSVFEERKSQVP